MKRKRKNVTSKFKSKCEHEQLLRNVLIELIIHLISLILLLNDVSSVIIITIKSIFELSYQQIQYQLKHHIDLIIK